MFIAHISYNIRICVCAQIVTVSSFIIFQLENGDTYKNCCTSVSQNYHHVHSLQIFREDDFLRTVNVKRTVIKLAIAAN